MKIGRQLRSTNPAAPEAPAAAATTPPAGALQTGHMRPVPATPLEVANVPKASPIGTQIALIGIALTAIFVTGKTPTDLGRFAAIGVGISLLCSIGFDLKRGVQNVIRADLMAILAFYFLTLFELLFTQDEFNNLTNVKATHKAVLIVLTGMAALLVGRHLARPKSQPFSYTLTREVPPGWMITIYWAAFTIGFSYMFMAVDFSLSRVFEGFTGPRFSQPWGRGKFGDWRALLYELNMLVYLVPPLAGVIYARRNRYGKFAIFSVTIGLLFTLFYSFSSGTRNLFAAHLVTLTIGYAFSLPQEKRRQLIPVCVTVAAIFLVASPMMLKFRNIGLANWVLTGEESDAPFEKTVFVDYNLCSIAQLTEVFPSRYPYMGWEIPYLALVRPIPRAIWKNKPEGMSTSIEEALGMENMTLSASFAGEAYISGGFTAVVLIGLFFGFATGWWSYLSSPRNSELGVLIYASGFFAAVISMRSLFAFTTALLPTVASIVIGTFAVRQLAAQAKRFLNRQPKFRGPPPRPRPPGAR
jgi:hypothetical protein